MANHNIPLITLGILLVIVGIFLFNSLKVWGIIALIVGIIALIRTITLKSDRKKEESKEEASEEDETIPEAGKESESEEGPEENNELEEKSDDEENPDEILGLKVKSGIHTKILKKIEPSVDALKPMIFWPFVGKAQPKGDEQKQSKELKYCKECGARIPRTAKFCPECGK